MVTTYRDWKVGDVINVCASIDEFCGSYDQFIYANDINVTKSPNPCSLEFGTERGCGLHLNNVELTFKLVKISGSAEGKSCNPQQIYKTIGSGRTDSNGVVGLVYTVTDQDRIDYENASGSGSPYRVIACITNPDGQAIYPTQVSIVSDDITVTPGIVATNTIDLIVEPWPWYDPNGAAVEIVRKLADIDGAITNFFATYGIIDYQYLNTEVITSGNHVIIRANLRKTGLSGLAWPLAAKVVITVVAIGIIIFAIGKIVDLIFGTPQGLTNQKLTDAGKEYMNDQISDCETKICNIPDLTQDQKAECIRNCRSNSLINWKDYYNTIYPGADHTPLVTGEAEIQSCYNTYLASARTPADFVIFNSCSKSKGQDAVTKDADKVLIIYPPEAPAGSKEKPTDWGAIVLVGGIVLLGIIFLTRGK